MLIFYTIHLECFSCSSKVTPALRTRCGEGSGKDKPACGYVRLSRCWIDFFDSLTVPISLFEVAEFRTKPMKQCI